MFKHQFSQ